MNDSALDFSAPDESASSRMSSTRASLTERERSSRGGRSVTIDVMPSAAASVFLSTGSFVVDDTIVLGPNDRLYGVAAKI